MLTPSRFLSGRVPVDLRHFSQSIKVIRPGNSTSPSLMASSNVAPSGLPATCFDMLKVSAVCAQDLSLRAQNGPRGEPYGAPTAQRSVGPSLCVQKDRAASLQHAHAGKSVGPSLRVREGPRDGPKARARNPGQDTKCTLRSKLPRTAPNCEAV